jgi:trigger factor
MDIEIKETHPCQREVIIRIPPEAMAEELTAVYRRFSQSRRIPGFRPGKAPREILEKRFVKEARAEAIGNRMAKCYSQAVREKGLKVVGDPVFKEVNWEDDQPAVFKAVVDIEPEVEIKHYKGIRVIKKIPKVDEKEVEDAFAALRERSASFEVVEGRELREGDYALIDYRTKQDEKSPWIENMLVEIRSGLSGDFSGQLVGMKQGEERAVKFKPLPPEGGGEKPEREIELAVRLREIKTKRLPELNDELASHWGDFKNLEEVRAKLRESILSRKEEATRSLEEQVMSFLLDKHRFVLPPRLSARMEEDYLGELRRYRGGETGEGSDLEEKARQRAERDLRLLFILNAIARSENLKVDPKAVGEEIRRQAYRMGTAPADYQRDLEEKGEMTLIESRLLRQQTMDFLLKEAKVKETG